MRGPLLLACAILLAGCATLEEKRLEAEARKVPLPPGATNLTYTSYCGSGCWGPNDAFASLSAQYEGNVTTLHEALVGALEADGWTLTETQPPTWREDGAMLGGSVRAEKDSIVAACYVGQTAQLEGIVGLTCNVDDA